MSIEGLKEMLTESHMCDVLTLIEILFKEIVKNPWEEENLLAKFNDIHVFVLENADISVI